MSKLRFSPAKQLWMINRLASERGRILREALQKTVEQVGVQAIDDELHRMVGSQYLNKLGAYGLRGETLFAVPCIIRARPTVSGYYRLVLGMSGKDYGRQGLDKWIQVEKEESSALSDQEISSLCESLIRAAEELIAQIDTSNITNDLFHELSLLTLGAQLNGSYRVTIGQQAVAAVRRLIEKIVGQRCREVVIQGNVIRFANAAGRMVEIRFGSDPDILVTEKIGDQHRQVLSVEVKGGTDPSNIHNRLGEAEKSHLKLSA
ncbi:MAG: XcyI family restriction endonuclease [Bacillota bacterium]